MNLRALEKINLSPGKAWKFESEKGYEPCNENVVSGITYYMYIPKTIRTPPQVVLAGLEILRMLKRLVL